MPGNSYGPSLVITCPEETKLACEFLVMIPKSGIRSDLEINRSAHLALTASALIPCAKH